MSLDRQSARRLAALEEQTEQRDVLAQLVLLISLGKLLTALALGVDALEKNYSRAELDAIATGCGIEDPDKLPNKRVLAEHIHDTIIPAKAKR